MPARLAPKLALLVRDSEDTAAHRTTDSRCAAILAFGVAKHLRRLAIGFQRVRRCGLLKARHAKVSAPTSATVAGVVSRRTLVANIANYLFRFRHMATRVRMQANSLSESQFCGFIIHEWRVSQPRMVVEEGVALKNAPVIRRAVGSTHRPSPSPGQEPRAAGYGVRRQAERDSALAR